VQAGKKVLVVDCDPQANATVGLRYISQATGKNMYDVFLSGFEDFPETFPVTPISEIIRNTPSGIDLAPSHLDLVGADPYLYRMEGRAGILKAALDPVRDQYDYILIDTPPSLGQLVINGLYAADHLIVTLDSGSFALDGVATLSTIFSDMKEDLGREIKPDMAIVSRWAEGATPAAQEGPGEKKDLMSVIRALFYKKPEPTQDEIRSAEEQKAEHERLLAMISEVQRLFPAVYTIPYSPLIYEAQKRGMPISHFAPESSAGVAYKTIATEVLRWK